MRWPKVGRRRSWWPSPGPRPRRLALLSPLVSAALTLPTSAQDAPPEVSGDGATPSYAQLLEITAPQAQQPRGGGSVGDKGDYQFRYPVPSLPALLAPRVAVAFSSDGGWTAEMTGGWSVDAVMELRRLRTPGHVSATNPEGVLALSGGGLSGVLWPEEGDLVLRKAGPGRVRAEYDAGADRWSVHVDAVTWTLEAADAGASEGNAWGTHHWRASSAVDRHGNEILARYSDDGRFLLEELLYGGNAVTGDPHTARMSFRYLVQANGPTQMQGGFPVPQERRLDAIDLEVLDGAPGSTGWTRYGQIDIEYADHSGTQLVSAIRREGRTDAKVLETTTFEYSSLEAFSAPERTVVSVPGDAHTKVPIAGDFSVISHTDSYLLSMPGEEPQVVGGQTDVYNLRVDWNGDGLPDHVSAADYLLGRTAWAVQLGVAVDREAKTFEWSQRSGAPLIAYLGPTPAPALFRTRTASTYQPSRPLEVYQEIAFLDVDGDGFPDSVTSEDEVDWKVSYGNGIAFEAAVVEASPWRYSQTSFAPDMERAPDWTCDTVQRMVDLNGDGWIDLLDGPSGDVWLHSGARGGGWSKTPVSWGTGLGCARQVANDGEVAYVEQSTGIWRYHVDRSRELVGLHDMNGDGLVDWVDSSTTPWQVRFNLRDVGFDPWPVDWEAPVAHAQVVDEGWPQITFPSPVIPLVCCANPQASVVEQALQDVDSDGLVDLVVTADTPQGRLPKWHRNLGDGFDVLALDVPSWWIDLGSTSAISGPGGGVTKQETELLDLDADGVLDYHTRFLQRTQYGNHPAPYRLVGVTTSGGLETDVAYRPSSLYAPSASNSLVNGQRLSCAGHKDVVSEVTRTDVVSGVSARTEYGWGTPTFVRGLFHGFEEASFFTQSDESATVVTATTYALDRDLPPLPTLVTQASDEDLTFAPELSRGWGSHTIRSRVTTAWDDFGALRLPVYRAIAEDGEGPGDDDLVEVVSYDWDDDGNLIRVWQDGGDDPLDAIETTFAYSADAEGDVTRIRERVTAGHDRSSGAWRAFERVVFLYDESQSPWAPPVHGQVTEKQTYAGWVDGGEALEDARLDQGFAYGPRGELLRETTPSGIVTEYAWTFGDALLAATRNALGHELAVEYDELGRMTRLTDPGGLAKTFLYDDFGRLTRRGVVPRGGSELLLETRAWYDTNLPRYGRSWLYDDAGSVDAIHYAVRNGFGDVVESAELGPDGTFRTTTAVFDVYGNLRRGSHPVETGATTFLPSPIPIGVARIAEETYYDGFGRARQRTGDADHGEYPGLVWMDTARKTEAVDAATLRTISTFDAHGRLIDVEEGDWQLGTTSVATYRYDPLHRLVERREAGGFTVAWSYDGAGRLRRVLRNGAPWMTYAYDGELRTSSENAAGERVEHTYDAIGRVVTRTVDDPLAPGGRATYGFGYDAGYPGKPTSTVDPEGCESYGYDAFGRLSGATRAASGIGPKTFLYSYDKRGRPTATMFPSGALVTSTYANGWKTRDTVAPKGGFAFHVDYGYDPWGGLASWTSSNGQALAVERSTPLWPDALVYTTDAGVRMERRYGWRDNGMLYSVEMPALGVTRTFELDRFGQLWRVRRNGSLEEEFTWDASGNPLSITTLDGAWTYAAVDAQNRVPSRTAGGTTETYGYDAFGRRTSESVSGGATTTYAYDATSSLRSITVDGTERVRLARNAEGSLVRREVDGSEPLFVFRTWRSEGKGGPETEQWLPMVARVGGEERWLFADHDGHVGRVVDGAGKPVGLRRKSAFGLDLATNGPPWSLQEFHGLEREPDQPLVATGLRHLSLRDGTWLQPEPMLLEELPHDLLDRPRALATYRYAMNLPTSRSDRTGALPPGAEGEPEESFAPDAGELPVEPDQASFAPHEARALLLYAAARGMGNSAAAARRLLVWTGSYPLNLFYQGVVLPNVAVVEDYFLEQSGTAAAGRRAAGRATQDWIAANTRGMEAGALEGPSARAGVTARQALEREAGAWRLTELRNGRAARFVRPGVGTGVSVLRGVGPWLLFDVALHFGDQDAVAELEEMVRMVVFPQQNVMNYASQVADALFGVDLEPTFSTARSLFPDGPLGSREP